MPIQSPIFAPAIVLVLWSLFMLGWLALTRLPAMSKAGLDLTGAVGSRGANLEGVLPDRVNWKSHNYTHLMEQPTIFYATVMGIRGAPHRAQPRAGDVEPRVRAVHDLLPRDRVPAAARDQRGARDALGADVDPVIPRRRHNRTAHRHSCRA